MYNWASSSYTYASQVEKKEGKEVMEWSSSDWVLRNLYEVSYGGLINLQGRGILPETFGGVVWLSFQNPYRIYD